MSTADNTRTSPYIPLQFHGVRAISAISCLIVITILVSFSIDLKNGGYKIPWTFLIALITSFATIASLLFTSLLKCCGRLSPIFNLILNIPLLILWLVSFAFFSWNIYGALAHSCSIANWANDDGVTVCSQFKALYSFIVFGALSQIAMIVVDVRARIRQNRSGEYEEMDADVKLEPYRSAPVAAVSQTSVHDEPFVESNEHQYHYRDETGWRPGQRVNENQSQIDEGWSPAQRMNENQFVHHQPQQEQVMYNNHDEYGNQHGDMGAVRMDDFRHNQDVYHDVYQRPTYQSYHTGYDNEQYGQRY